MSAEPDTPRALRARKRAERWDDDGGRAERGKRARTELHAFLERHLDLVRSSGQRLSADDYHTSRRVLYDDERERGLFVRYDALLGRDVYAWHRCQFALCRKVKVVQTHEVPWCDGWSKERGVGVTGPLLMRCGCPFRKLGEEHVWLVDPRDKVAEVEVEGRTVEVRHGTKLEERGQVTQ
jgi:hypothetical protein